MEVRERGGRGGRRNTEGEGRKKRRGKREERMGRTNCRGERMEVREKEEGR